MDTAKALSKIKLSLKRLPIYKYRYFWFIVPATILFIALVCGAVYSGSNVYGNFANVGIDFEGGTVLTVNITGGGSYADNAEIIEEVIEDNGLTLSSAQSSGASNVIARYSNFVNGADWSGEDKTEDMINLNSKVASDVEAAIKAKYPNAVVNATAETINATASQDFINKALLAVGVAMIVMLIYTAFRFDFFSGLAALCTQLIDVIVTMSLVVIFRVPINSSLVAALITVVAYSINNTIVIFDRVRENMAPYKHSDKNKADVPFILETSVTECLRRALFTTLTTLITIVTLAAWGIQSLSEFALPIIFGILSGLYSSIFLAPSIWGMLMDAKRNRAFKKRQLAKSKRR